MHRTMQGLCCTAAAALFLGGGKPTIDAVGVNRVATPADWGGTAVSLPLPTLTYHPTPGGRSW